LKENFSLLSFFFFLLFSPHPSLFYRASGGMGYWRRRKRRKQLSHVPLSFFHFMYSCRKRWKMRMGDSPLSFFFSLFLFSFVGRVWVTTFPSFFFFFSPPFLSSSARKTREWNAGFSGFPLPFFPFPLRGRRGGGGLNFLSFPPLFSFCARGLFAGSSAKNTKKTAPSFLWVSFFFSRRRVRPSSSFFSFFFPSSFSGMEVY